LTALSKNVPSAICTESDLLNDLTVTIRFSVGSRWVPNLLPHVDVNSLMTHCFECNTRTVLSRGNRAMQRVFSCAQWLFDCYLLQPTKGQDRYSIGLWPSYC